MLFENKTPMKLYHVANNEYQDEQVITVPEGEQAIYYQRADLPQKDTIDCLDNYIYKHYPNYQHRTKLLFAFDSPKFAYCFNKTGIIYEVEMDVLYKGPFVLNNTLMQFFDDERKAEAIMKEYVNPDNSIDDSKWLVFEYLGEEMKIIRRVQDNFCCDNFSADYEKAIRLFGDFYKGTTGKLG